MSTNVKWPDHRIRTWCRTIIPVWPTGGKLPRSFSKMHINSRGKFPYPDCGLEYFEPIAHDDPERPSLPEPVLAGASALAYYFQQRTGLSFEPDPLTSPDLTFHRVLNWDESLGGSIGQIPQDISSVNQPTQSDLKFVATPFSVIAKRDNRDGNAVAPVQSPSLGSLNISLFYSNATLRQTFALKQRQREGYKLDELGQYYRHSYLPTEMYGAKLPAIADLPLLGELQPSYVVDGEPPKGPTLHHLDVHAFFYASLAWAVAILGIERSNQIEEVRPYLLISDHAPTPDELRRFWLQHLEDFNALRGAADLLFEAISEDYTTGRKRHAGAQAPFTKRLADRYNDFRVPSARRFYHFDADSQRRISGRKPITLKYHDREESYYWLPWFDQGFDPAPPAPVTATRYFRWLNKY